MHFSKCITVRLELKRITLIYTSRKVGKKDYRGLLAPPYGNVYNYNKVLTRFTLSILLHFSLNRIASIRPECQPITEHLIPHDDGACRPAQQCNDLQCSDSTEPVTVMSLSLPPSMGRQAASIQKYAREDKTAEASARHCTTKLRIEWALEGNLNTVKPRKFSPTILEVSLARGIHGLYLFPWWPRRGGDSAAHCSLRASNRWPAIWGDTGQGWGRAAQSGRVSGRQVTRKP